MKNIKDFRSIVSSNNTMNEAMMTPAAVSQRMSKLSNMLGKLDTDAQRISKGNATSQELSMLEEIKDCIVSNNFTHLSVLTTGAGSYALGLVAALLSSGVGTIAGLALGVAGMIVIVLETSLGGDVWGSSATEEIEQLISCLEKKGVI